MAGTVIDWASKPYPWCEIGPELREECERIAAAPTPAAVPGDHENDRGESDV
jgi:hypothetical protein